MGVKLCTKNPVIDLILLFVASLSCIIKARYHCDFLMWVCRQFVLALWHYLYREIDYIISRWKSDTPEDYGSIGTKIVKTKKSVLMRPSGSEKKLEGNSFETPTSMRNVDKECQAIILTSFKGKLWVNIKEINIQKDQ